jgi:signal transduction histidine kinase
MKRDMKNAREVTPTKGRTPLGDKGLGRLGAQRLGYNLEIFTCPRTGDKQYHVAFSWNDFKNYSELTKVPVFFQELPKIGGKEGTTLLISEIRDTESWKESGFLKKLRDELSQMIMPYKELQKFSVLVTVDGTRIEFAEMTERLLNSAQVRYTVSFDGQKLRVGGKVRLNFFRPEKKEDKPKFRALVERDQGQQLFDFLCTQAKHRSKAEKFKLRKASEPGWFLQYDFERPFSDMDSLQIIDGKIANPGPFVGKIDSFDLGSESSREQNVFDTVSEYKKQIKALRGVRVYRDGFGIRLDRDWLGLGKQWTSATSYYGLKPENAIGFISLSARENSVLEETTDREGFKISPYYTNFLEILNQFKNFTLEAQGFFRRGWLEFRDANEEKAANIESGTTPEELTDKIVDGTSKAIALKKPLLDAKNALEETEKDAQQVAKGAQENFAQDSKQFQEIQIAAQRLLQSIEESKKTISLLDERIKELANLESLGGVLKNQVDQLRRQLAEVYETVSLGLTAEALTHEIHNVADRLAKEAEVTRRYIFEERSKDAKLISFIEYVASAVSALHKQLSHLSPSLKYMREKREQLDLHGFFMDQKEYYQSRFERNHINIDVSPTSKSFTIFMNRGKLTQIVDNLFLNSEYWLREDMRLGFIQSGTVAVILDKPYIRVQDNGRGIDPSVETTLFEPFVTTKGRDKGRGLGLFIVRQLLDSEGCSISLLPERNEHGRMYIFEIDLSGGLDGSG